ncbi:MAG: hypothetical protein J6Y07_03915 [Alphaproteobacteria bacterium]|nr:hypothetical protein [Alphaproteobacteria bacterium]
MSRITKVFLIVGVSSVSAGFGHAVSMSPLIQDLLFEKQQKIETLEKCEGKKQGWMIAGISTIGLTAIGVAGNVVLANKNKDIDVALDTEKTKLATAKQELNDIKSQIVAEKQRREQLEQEKQKCNNTEGKYWNSTEEKCIDASLVKVSAEGHGTQKPTVTGSIAEKPYVPGTHDVPIADTGRTEPKVDATKWTKETYQQCLANFYNEYAMTVSSNLKAKAGVRWYWSKSHNGKWCEGYQYGKYLYDYKKNPNPCTKSKFTSLANGEWAVTLQNGKNAQGTAMCSTTKGNVSDELRDNIDTSGNGMNCWCKLTQTDLSECLVTQKFSWIYMGEESYRLVNSDDLEHKGANSDSMPDDYYQLGQNDCLWRCATECGQQMFDYGGRDRMRTMHGVPWIKLYDVDRQALIDRMHNQ